MTTSKEIMAIDTEQTASATAAAGNDPELRSAIFEALRCAEQRSREPEVFRREVRTPLIRAMLGKDRRHIVELSNGLKFEVAPVSRIELALLLSTEERPDHVWEPQTTKLLTTLANGADDVIVGGAYIGDHVLPLAREAKTVHAFEPMAEAFGRLVRNLELNGLQNVIAHCVGLWDRSGERLRLDGLMALASSSTAPGGDVEALAIDDYSRQASLESVDLIMLDTEGGEERALIGAAAVLEHHSPNLVFEVHRNFVDWTCGLENTSIIRFVAAFGYQCFAVRDYHDNVAMHGSPVELIPAASVYLEGPPHGFNVFATREPTIIDRHGFAVVEGVSPKLLHGRDPRLHAPLH
jgi:FkbM family methyltransferase